MNHAGRTAPGWREQKMLLEDEGVEFKGKWMCRYEAVSVGGVVFYEL